MKSVIFRSVCAVGSVVVSTARIGNGVYETAFVVNGRVSDGYRSRGKDAAAVAHDRACDFANYPSQREPHSRFAPLYAQVTE